MIGMRKFGVSLVLLASVYASADSVEWGICRVDLEKTGCGKSHDDHEKHECLERKGKDTVSKECLAHNKTLEGSFKGKHKIEHKK